MNVSSVGKAPATNMEAKNPLKAVKMPGSGSTPQAKSIERMRSPQTPIMRKVSEEVSKATKLRPRESYIRFEIHKATGTIVAKIVDAKTNEVLKEIPPEKLLNMMVDIQALVGVLLNRRG